MGANLEFERRTNYFEMPLEGAVEFGDHLAREVRRNFPSPELLVEVVSEGFSDARVWKLGISHWFTGTG